MAWWPPWKGLERRFGGRDPGRDRRRARYVPHPYADVGLFTGRPSPAIWGSDVKGRGVTRGGLRFARAFACMHAAARGPLRSSTACAGSRGGRSRPRRRAGLSCWLDVRVDEVRTLLSMMIHTYQPCDPPFGVTEDGSAAAAGGRRTTSGHSRGAGAGGDGPSCRVDARPTSKAASIGTKHCERVGLGRAGATNAEGHAFCVRSSVTQLWTAMGAHVPVPQGVHKSRIAIDTPRPAHLAQPQPASPSALYHDLSVHLDSERRFGLV